MKEVKTVKDIKGNEVLASDIDLDFFEGAKKGTYTTLRNNDYTFWASVVVKSISDKKITCASEIYGWVYTVDFENNTVTRR